MVTMAGEWWCILCFIIIGYIKSSGASCPQNSGGVNTFGPNCEYMCHCKNSDVCDSDTGECVNGCDTKWFGPGCQYRDLAEKEVSRHFDNLPNAQYADKANDGKPSTCSSTNTSTAWRRSRNPWWRVQLPNNETIMDIIIVTEDKYLDYFKSFKVTIETAPSSKLTMKNYYPPASQVQFCYQHNNFAPTNKTIYVTCGTPLLGNLVRITLATTDTQLVLCDVRINGGRNVAFGKSISFSAANDENLYSPANAVDGSYASSGWSTCFAIEDFTSQLATDWLTVDLGYQSHITSIRITKLNNDRIRNFSLFVSNTTPDLDEVKVHDDTGNDPPSSVIPLNIIGRYIKISRPAGKTVVCEFEVFGDCTAGKCGLDCSKNCHCKTVETIEDKISGDCPSGCEGRWTGSGKQCIIECERLQWGEECTRQCGKCKSSDPCDVVTGYCPFGCEDGYNNTYLCDTECPDGTYGENCMFICAGNCKNGDACRKSDGQCDLGCAPGYTGSRCVNKCSFGFYGNGCTSLCSTNCYGGYGNCNHINGTCSLGCLAGYEGNRCDKECDNGFWYNNCERKCGKCKSGTCRRTYGYCDGGCLAGYKTGTCDQECDDKRFGEDCRKRCNPNCVDICDKVNGTCVNCTTGWKGETCDIECDANEWGENCAKTCGFCSSGTCNRFYGSCLGGCLPGYRTAMCTEKCLAGTYGTGCLETCPSSCKIHGQCNNVNGSCDNCRAGKQGYMCDRDCDSGRYGDNCVQECGSCANNETCNSETGVCTKGCSKGYKHSPVCQEVCDDGSHGDNCTGVCGNCKPGTFCDKVTGHCNGGCSERFSGMSCVQALPQTNTNDGGSVGGIVGGVVAAVVAIAILLLVILLLRRRKMRLTEKPDNQIAFENIQNQQNDEDVENVKQNDVYMNSTEMREEFARSNVPQNVSNMKREESMPAVKDDSNDIYYNEGPLSKQRSEHSVAVADLIDYVKKRSTRKNNFADEFQNLPSGLQHPTSVATKSGNSGKNRYKAMYAYDHARVILSTLPGDKDSDYINAAFIRGHLKEKAYIAAQGPIDFTMDDFWRMIWEKDVYTIVMATRLVEEMKMKCKQYWPNVEESLQYGKVSVHVESENTFAEFTVRHLKVSHQDKPDQVRNVTQFHYTAWPDKDVPKSTTSLLHFWYQVRKNDEQKTNPWLVHCSAGVGRTGTFIALDVLYDQGKDVDFVDIFGCVRDLRDQRATMVQTQEQYRYLHNLLVEALVLPSKPIHIDEIPVVYSDLEKKDKSTGKTKLLLEYETLLDDTGGGSEAGDVDEMYASAKQTENRNKNRYSNILAANEYRPYLFSQVEGCTDYINAVYIPSYRDTHGYIITQTPLRNTAIDCCRLVYEQEASVVVTFDEKVDNETSAFLPDNGSVTHGPFTITLLSKQDNGSFLSRLQKIEFNSREHTFTQLIYKRWSPAQVTPDDPLTMLVFLQHLECIQRQTEDKPVIVQCLNGAERSGLVVVLMNLMERVRMDGEVSIPQVIRQLQIRRQQIIPNVDQFRFCYCVLKAHAENNATYANV